MILYRNKNQKRKRTTNNAHVGFLERDRIGGGGRGRVALLRLHARLLRLHPARVNRVKKDMLTTSRRAKKKRDDTAKQRYNDVFICTQNAQREQKNKYKTRQVSLSLSLKKSSASVTRCFFRKRR